MGYAAIACLEDAFRATKAFLLPVERGRWLRLAVVVFFLSGGAGSGAAPNLGSEGSAGQTDLSVVIDGSLGAVAPFLIGAAMVITLVGITFLLVGSVMEFVLVEALRTESVRVRAPAREHLRDGLALFVFRVVLGGLVIGLLAGFGYFVVLPAFADGGVQIVLSLLVGVLLAAGLLLVAGLVHGLTVEFAVPIMVHEGCGLRRAWGHLWSVIRGNLGQVVVYVLVRFVLALGVSLVASTAAGILGVVLLVPFALVGTAAFFAFGGTLTLTTGIAVGVLAAASLLVLSLVLTVVQVPLKTGTRYYELLVLGDIEPDFDLVADRRATSRVDATG